MAYISHKYSQEIVDEIKRRRDLGESNTEIGRFFNMSRNTVAGIYDRLTVKRDDPRRNKRQKAPAPAMMPGSNGVIERQTNDLSRITLVAIPSLGELAPKAYSYIARDQIVGTRTRGRRSAV